MRLELGGDWSSLVVTAMLGCERSFVMPALPAELSPLADEGDAPEQRLLEHAALLSPWSLAGYLPQPGSCDHAASAADTQRPANSIAAVLAPEYQDLLPEWCAAAARANCRVPHHLLPEFLDRMAAEKSPAMVAAMRAVLGARGQWLALLNPDWRGAAPPADARIVWEAGTRSERIALLQQLRANDPALARTLIASTLETDEPDDVAACLAPLATGLTPQDHDFLEGLLDARNKPVRSAAARLLAALPQSARGDRLVQWLAAHVRFAPGSAGFFKKGRGAIEVTIADNEDAIVAKALTRDGIESAKKRGKLGAKAHTLLQVVAGIPLAWFATHWQAKPAELIDAALGGEWAEAMLFGWSEAAVSQRDAEWAEALLLTFTDKAGAIAGGLEGAGLGGLLRLLAPDARERFLAKLLGDRPAAIHEAGMHQLLKAADHAWSAAFSRDFLKIVRSHYLKETSWDLRAQMKRLAANLSIQSAAGIREGWPTEAAQWTAADNEMLERLAATLELRSNYLQELTP